MTHDSPLPPTASPIIFSDDNHWRFGWGDGLYNFHEQHLPRWVKFGPARYDPKTFDVEVTVAARKVADANPKPIYVPLSGGIDSEILARVLLKEKIPFTPLIVRFEGDYNKFDIAYAFEWCQKNGVEPEVMDIDIFAFMKANTDTPYVLASCANLLNIHLMRYGAKKGFITIIAGGEQRLKEEDGKIFTDVSIQRVAKAHFMQAENIQAVSSFFYYTPEMMLSFFREAKARGFENMEAFGHNIKADIYHKFWPDLVRRPKYSGFEKVRGRRLVAEYELYNKYGARLSDLKLPIDEFELQLTGGKY